MPKRKAPSADGAKEEPKRKSARLMAKYSPAPVDVESEPEKATGKDESSDKNVPAKRKSGAKGEQSEVTNPETKADPPTQNEETQTEESATTSVLDQKEPKSN